MVQGTLAAGQPSLAELKEQISKLLEQSNNKSTDCRELDRYVWIQHLVNEKHPILTDANAHLFVLRPGDVMSPSHLKDIGVDFNGIYNISPPTALTNILVMALPYLRHNRRPFPAIDNLKLTDLMELARIMFASCIGLFPNTQRRPIWSMRVKLHAFFRDLICQSKARLHQFCCSQFGLLRLAVVEYCVYFLSNVAPVELKLQSLMSRRQSDIDAVFDHITFTVDAFRRRAFQDTTDVVDWQLTAAAASESYDRLCRLCKCKDVETQPAKQACISRQHAQLALGMPRIAHEAYMRLLPCPAELLDTHTLAQVLDVQKSVQVWALPHNVFHKQASKIRQDTLLNGLASRTCMTLYVCLVCSSRSQHTQSRMRFDRNTEAVCDQCKRTDSIVSIFMPGRIVSVFGKFFYLCPYCTTVHSWRADGTDLFGCPDSRCPVRNTRKNQCHICRRQAFQTVTVLDDRLGVLQAVWLCRWHTPSPRSMAAVFNADMLWNVISTMRH